jgi:hypothetical protein
MNTLTLFAVGIILGILLSMTIIQNDLWGRLMIGFSNVKSPVNEESMRNSHALKKDAIVNPLFQPLKDVEKVEKKASGLNDGAVKESKKLPTEKAALTTKKATENVIPQDSEVSKVKKPPIKWAPGKENNLNKFIQEADNVQQHIFGEKLSSASSTSEVKADPERTIEEYSLRDRGGKKGGLNGKNKGRLGSGNNNNERDGLSSIKDPTIRGSIVAVNNTETPINLQNQVKLYKKLKKKEKLFGGDNDEINNEEEQEKNSVSISTDSKDSSTQRKEKGTDSSISGTTTSLSPLSSTSSAASTSATTSISSYKLTNGIGKALISYHDQCYRDFSSYKPLVSSLETATKEGSVSSCLFSFSFFYFFFCVSLLLPSSRFFFLFGCFLSFSFSVIVNHYLICPNKKEVLNRRI